MVAPSEWINRAACAGRENLGWHLPTATLEMLELCGRCPVRVECLMTALDTRAEYDCGIWAGTTPGQREAIRRGKLEPWQVWEWQGYPYQDKETNDANDG